VVIVTEFFSQWQEPQLWVEHDVHDEPPPADAPPPLPPFFGTYMLLNTRRTSAPPQSGHVTLLRSALMLHCISNSFSHLSQK